MVSNFPLRFICECSSLVLFIPSIKKGQLKLNEVLIKAWFHTFCVDSYVSVLSLVLFIPSIKKGQLKLNKVLIKAWFHTSRVDSYASVLSLVSFIPSIKKGQLKLNEVLIKALKISLIDKEKRFWLTASNSQMDCLDWLTECLMSIPKCRST